MRWFIAVALASCATEKKDHKYFEKRVGQTVKLVGAVAQTPWQHMTGGVPGKSIVYMDLDGGKHQIVAHFAQPPSCSGDVAFEGKIFEVRGPSKAARRGEPGAARDEYWEYVIDVDSWRCR
jgi:hypothetical protein